MTAVTTSFAAGLAAAFGAVLGSFLNVVAYRLPRGESLAAPRSRCPSCETPIKPYDNVPVLSWLLLRGRCRKCNARISRRYPLVELLTAVLLALAVVTKGADEDVWLGLAFVLLLVPIALIDLDHRIIPNQLTALGSAAAIAILLLTDPSALPEHLIAGLAAGGVLLVAAIVHPAGMGVGDVKLAGMMGLFLGRAVGPAMLVGMLAASVVGVAVMARKGVAAGRKEMIPFGPFLALGGLVGLYFGDALVDWYLDTFA